MRHLRHIAHVIYASVAIHGSILISDRFKDAYADVGFDHGMSFIEQYGRDIFHCAHEEDGK